MLNSAKEQHFLINGTAGLIECRLTASLVDGALGAQHLVAIICHPHPQQGGTMDNKVVTTLVRAYRDLGIRVLSFNFRGVGKSEGEFDLGRGEQADLRSAIAYIKEHFPTETLLLAGFSFGSSIVAQVSYEIDLRHLLLIAPPIERYHYDVNGTFSVPVTVVQGDLDERVVADGVYRWVNTLKSPVELIRYPEAGHFFHGFLSPLKQDVMRSLSIILGESL